MLGIRPQGNSVTLKAIKQNKKYLILIYVIGIIIPFLTLNSLIPDPYGDFEIVRIPGMISLIYGFALLQDDRSIPLLQTWKQALTPV